MARDESYQADFAITPSMEGTGYKSEQVNVTPFLNAVAALHTAKEHLDNEFLRILKAKVNGWEDIDINDVTLDQIGGAMTNLIFICSKPDGLNSKVLLRVYGEGTDMFFPREQEVKLFKILSEKNTGIGLLGEFGNGRIEKIIEGKTCTSKDMRTPEISRKIAKRMKFLHGLELPIDHSPSVILKIREFLEKAKKLCTSDRFKDINFQLMDQYIVDLEELINTTSSPVVFGHCDLQYGNIMISGENVVLIDYEYSGYNPRGFDIGNHFCEWAYNYHHPHTPHVGNYSKYPSEDEQKNFCRSYLQGHSDGDVDECDIRQLMKEASIYSQASHLFWALWGFIQCQQSDIDFDFFAYGYGRLQAFLDKTTLQL